MIELSMKDFFNNSKREKLLHYTENTGCTDIGCADIGNKVMISDDRR